MRKLLVSLGLLVAVSLQAQTDQKLTQLTGRLMQQFDIPSMSLAVQPEGGASMEVVNQGVVSQGAQQHVGAQSLYQIGSITKTFTAYLIKQAVDQHHLQLSDSLTEYLPQYKHWRQVTIGDLVNQTSGIVDYDHTKNWWQKLYDNPRKVWMPAQLLALSYKQPLNFKPGTYWQYSNTNYVLLGEVLSVVNKRPYAQQLHQLIQVAKLSNTHYAIKPYSKPLMASMVHGYFQYRDQTMINGSWLQSAGGLVSNPVDIVSWYPRLLDQPGMRALKNYVSIPSAKQPKGLTQMAYSFAVFRMNTPAGLIYFTPGLTPGYVSAVGYIPCSHTYFAYSAAKAPLRGFHHAMMMALLKQFNSNKACNVKPAKAFVFPPFD